MKVLKGHKYFNHLPSDARTLYQINFNISYNIPVQVETIPTSIYYRFGLSIEINKYLEKHFSDEIIKIVIGVDGLPLSKSYSFCLILGYIRQKNQVVFPIGFCWGHKKPYNNNIFMEDFIDEVKNLYLNGICVKLINKDNEKIVIQKNFLMMPFVVIHQPKHIYLK